MLLQFWATWSDAAKHDMPALKELTAKYGRNFAVVGVSLDYDLKDLEKFLAENKLPWPQIFEAGGLDSPPATSLASSPCPR